MGYSNKLFCIILLAFLASVELYAQQTNPASGGTNSGSGGNVSYTIGQVVYTSAASATGSMSQGIQNAYDISVVTETSKAKGITLSCTATPNPVIDILKLKVDGDNLGSLSFFLYDVKGAILEKGAILDGEAIINMSALSTGTYYIKVIVDSESNVSQAVKTFKIIKNR